MLFKNLSKKVIVFFISLTIVVGIIPTSGISARTKVSYDEIIAIVHTNDVHGHIEVEPYVKALTDNLKTSGKYSLVLTVSAGDIYGGGESVAGYYQGELIPQIVDRVYDVIVPGNNDFGTDLSKREEYNLFLTSFYTHTKTICANFIATHDIDLPSYAASYMPKISNTDLADMYDRISLNADGSLDYTGLNLPAIAQGENPYEQTVCYLTDKGTKIGLFGLTVNGKAAFNIKKERGFYYERLWRGVKKASQGRKQVRRIRLQSL